MKNVKIVLVIRRFPKDQLSLDRLYRGRLLCTSFQYHWIFIKQEHVGMKTEKYATRLLCYLNTSATNNNHAPIIGSVIGISDYRPLFLVSVSVIYERCNRYCKKCTNNVISCDYSIINCLCDTHN